MPKVGDHTFAVGRESTYGTAVSPTRRFEVVSEGLKLGVERVESKALRNSRRFLSSSGWAAGQKSVEGDFELEVPSAGFGTLLRNLLGAATVTNNSPVPGTYMHVFSGTADVDSESLTIEIARTDVAGTAHKFVYEGVKFVDGELSAQVGEFLTFKASCIGEDETVTAASPSSASYPTATPLVFTGATLTVGGSTATVKQFTTRIETGLKTDRYFLGSQLRSKPVEAEMRSASGQLTVEWTGLTQYQRFTQGTTAAISAKFETQSAIVGSTKGYVQVDIPVARFDGETPVGGGDIIEQGIDFVALDDGTNDPFKITVVSTDSTY